MHRRQRVEVGIDRVDAGVEQDHAQTACLRDRQALVDACRDATVADDDLAGHFGRIEHRHATVVHGSEAQGHSSRIGTRQAGGRRIDQRLRGQRGRQRRTRIRHAVAQGDRALTAAVVRACGHCGQPRTRVRHRAGRRPAVARRGGHEHAGVGGEQEGDLDRVAEVGPGAADREVDDIHPVGDGLVDGRNAVGAGAPAGTTAPADLVGRNAGPRRDAADAAENRRCAGRRDIRIAARRGGCVGAVTIRVAWRIEVGGKGRVDAGVATEAGVVVARADQFVVAVGGGKGLARGALAVPAGDLPVVQLTVRGGVAIDAGSVREAGMFWPRAGVHDADDHVFAGRAGRAVKAGRPGEAQKCWRRRGVQLTNFVFAHRQYTRRLRQLLRLSLGQLSGKAVEHVSVVVEFLGTADAAQQRVLARRQVAHVAVDLRVVRVDFLALARLRGRVALDVAGVSSHRLLGQLHDVGLVGGLCRVNVRCRMHRHAEPRDAEHDRRCGRGKQVCPLILVHFLPRMLVGRRVRPVPLDRTNLLAELAVHSTTSWHRVLTSLSSRSV